MRRLHGWAIDRFGILIWLVPITIVSALVYLLSEIMDIPRLSVWWGSIWTPAFFAGGWNAIDSYLDLRANERAKVSSAQIATAQWSFRLDVMLTLESFAMSAAGAISIFQIAFRDLTPGALAVALLFFAGADHLTLALWNRSDRWTVLRLRRRSQLLAKGKP